MNLTISQPMQPRGLGILVTLGLLIEKAHMWLADQFCDAEVEDYIALECGSELGGIVAIGIIGESAYVGENDTEKVTNLEDESWWADLMGGSPPIAWILKGTRGSLAAGTPTEEEGYGLVATERTGDDRELIFEVPGVFNNRGFVAGINKKRNLKLVYVTAGKNGTGYEAFYVEGVSIYMSDLIEQSIKSRKRWSSSAKWSTDMTPGLPFVAPAELFI